MEKEREEANLFDQILLKDTIRMLRKIQYLNFFVHHVQSLQIILASQMLDHSLKLGPLKPHFESTQRGALIKMW